MGIPLASSAQQFCTLQVTILDNSRNPISKAIISIRRESGGELFSATSDTQGLANISGTICGKHELIAEKTGFFPTSEPIELTGAKSSVQVILQTLKSYGMFVADNGSNWYVSGAPDPRWSDDELHTLTHVTGKNFEVVRMGPLTTR